MKVRELMSSPAHTCRAQDTLAQAAELMWRYDCGMLPVVDANGRIGAAITDRDICMGALHGGRSLGDLRVSGSMSDGVVTCTADEEVAAVARRMAEHQLHRLPVVDGDGKPLGVIALNDLALAARKDTNVAREALQTLIAASHHRAAAPQGAARGKPAAVPVPGTTAPPATAVGTGRQPAAGT